MPNSLQFLLAPSHLHPALPPSQDILCSPDVIKQAAESCQKRGCVHDTLPVNHFEVYYGHPYQALSRLMVVFLKQKMGMPVTLPHMNRRGIKK